ncbi:hypothetical protein M758_7G087500, partial [Ceratodon purpureus]
KLCFCPRIKSVELDVIYLSSPRTRPKDTHSTQTLKVMNSMKDQSFWLGSFERISTVRISVDHSGKVSSSPPMPPQRKDKSQISKEGLEAASALEPGRAKALGGHCECLRNKPKDLSSSTGNATQKPDAKHTSGKSQPTSAETRET